jgi:hypothetical protein
MPKKSITKKILVAAWFGSHMVTTHIQTKRRVNSNKGKKDFFSNYGRAMQIEILLKEKPS